MASCHGQKVCATLNILRSVVPQSLVSDIAIFVLKRDVKLQLTNRTTKQQLRFIDIKKTTPPLKHLDA